ncbi:hypothetical protein Tco_0823999 [Tanacetum coccineum]|uniref:Uncharacterized protein n=1 Tax=Tanacetum coccineum TaxID=301880 RepID=A0ABQ5AJI6_9ASTR
MVKMVPHEAFACRTFNASKLFFRTFNASKLIPSDLQHLQIFSKLKKCKCSTASTCRRKISVLKATMDMHMHPEQHIVNSAALLYEVLNEMKKLDLE